MNPLNARWTMYRTQSSVPALAIVAALALGACQERAPTEASSRLLAASAVSLESSGRYVVVFSAERVPVDFGERVAALGGSIEAALDSIGVAAVTGLSEAGAAELAAAADIRAVEPDPMTSPRDDGEATDGLADEAVSEAAVPADATASPTAAQFYARQWNLRAVFAPDAWAAGFLGSRDVVVAILDTGIDYTNPDLAGLVDLDRSISFVPEDVTRHYPGRLPFSDLFWHGTAVASAVASNASVLAGVNRYVTLLAVKVADSTNTHTAGRIISGIVYAADQGADVINVSRGSQRDRRLDPGTVVAYERAVNYAFRKGALVVRAVGGRGRARTLHRLWPLSHQRGRARRHRQPGSVPEILGAVHDNPEPDHHRTTGMSSAPAHRAGGRDELRGAHRRRTCRAARGATGARQSRADQGPDSPISGRPR